MDDLDRSFVGQLADEDADRRRVAARTAALALVAEGDEVRVVLVLNIRVVADFFHRLRLFAQIPVARKAAPRHLSVRREEAGPRRRRFARARHHGAGGRREGRVEESLRRLLLLLLLIVKMKGRLTEDRLERLDRPVDGHELGVGKVEAGSVETAAVVLMIVAAGVVVGAIPVLDESSARVGMIIIVIIAAELWCWDGE